MKILSLLPFLAACTTVTGDENASSAPSAEHASLAESAWLIVGIDGESVSGTDYNLLFGPSRMGGQAGCNRFSGDYSISGGRLTSGPLMATRMVCPEPRMGHERKAMALLARPVTIRFLAGNALLLTSENGSLRLTRDMTMLFD